MHEKHLLSTPLDHLTSWSLLAFYLFIIIMIAGPARILARERNVTRTEDVRDLMTAAIELEEVYPGAYHAIIQRLEDTESVKMMLGQGSCEGDFGDMCSDLAIDDTCINPSDYFTDDILDKAPVDPKKSVYSENSTGYYFSLYQGRLEVGACDAALGPIVLRR